MKGPRIGRKSAIYQQEKNEMKVKLTVVGRRRKGRQLRLSRNAKCRTLRHLARVTSSRVKIRTLHTRVTITTGVLLGVKLRILRNFRNAKG